MNDAPLFSIIVPIYNVQSYLKECLDSLLEQSYKDFEIILINDGSTDKSGEIAQTNETYAFYYRCIRTLLKRIMRILNNLPWSDEKADIIQSIKPLYTYAPYRTKFSMNFPHFSAFATKALSYLKSKKD